jgi:hypothetical protein
MTSPSSKEPHTAVLVEEPVLAHLHSVASAAGRRGRGPAIGPDGREPVSVRRADGPLFLSPAGLPSTTRTAVASVSKRWRAVVLYSRRSETAHFPRRRPAVVRLPSAAQVGLGRSILALQAERSLKWPPATPGSTSRGDFFLAFRVNAGYISLTDSDLPNAVNLAQLDSYRAYCCRPSGSPPFLWSVPCPRPAR